MFVRLDVHSWKNNHEAPTCQNREKALKVGVAEKCAFNVIDCLILSVLMRYVSEIIGIFFEVERIIARKGNEFDTREGGLAWVFILLFFVGPVTWNPETP